MRRKHQVRRRYHGGLHRRDARPDNVRVCGLPVAVSTIVMDPGRTPTAVGLKFIVIEHVNAGRKFALTQLVLTSRKSPVSYTRLMERDLFPVLVTTTDRLLEVPPTGVSGNVTEGEDRDRVVVGARAVPELNPSGETRS